MMRSFLFFCALAGALLTLCSCKYKYTLTTKAGKAGQHNVVIIKMKPRSETGTSPFSIDSNGDFSYECSDLKVRFENEVLMVNSKRYVIPHKDDSIKVVDGRAGIRVEINGQLAKPEGGS